ncbi:AAA domain-containing protein [Acholeplasma granularum]|uniref:AAA domain-containing protein n=1 Tax=Acholeplasma granularum TaxID=264635 RepID=UPI00138AF6DD|nr:AAA domain-containing protein [Acholeplasma granularum]
MMSAKNELLELLYNLRNIIREDHFFQTGEKIDVCTDKALVEMSNSKPNKVEDFNAYSGLGPEFLRMHAQRFLNVIVNYTNLNSKQVKVSKSATKVLHHYKDRLTDMSKSNVNLYLGKINQNHSFDLTHLTNQNELVDYLTNNRVKNLRLVYNEQSFESHITKLYREVNKTFKDTGSYNLYIAYPFIEGVFSKDKFPIKAPLLYFPVKLERTLRTFTIKKDQDKDIILNRDLLLLTSKMEKSSIDATMPQITEFSLNVLTEVIIPFYEKHGLNINKQFENKFIPFLNELKDDFLKRKHLGFIIKPYITLSRFQVFSSSIQKDMEKILQSKTYNELLEGLIDETNLFKSAKTELIEVTKSPIDEENISYINDLNYSQEKVIDLLNTEKKIVIWGPPGTGKSQTITSLISTSILKGENVLVVSEKKVALDVIYSRLKTANRYAMFIDDAENKQDFYDKLNKFLDPVAPVRTMNNDIYSNELEIKRLLNDMDQSLKLLYDETIEGIPVFQLYKRYIKDKDILNHLTPSDIHKIFNENYKKINFQIVDALEKTFDTDLHLKRMLDFDYYFRNYKIMHMLETKITRSQKIIFEQLHNDYLNIIDIYEKKTYFKQRKIRNKFVNEYIDSMSFLSQKKKIRKNYLNLMFKNKDLHHYIYDNITSLNKYKTIYQNLRPAHKTFLKMLNTNNQLKDITDIYKYRKYIFDGFYSGYLEEFKASHQKYLYIFDNYQTKLESIKDLMNIKMNITIESFEMALYKHALNLNNTKRIMDIKRIFEQDSKPSIKSFIETFNVEMSKHIRLWMMTPEVVSTILPLESGMFDLVIFDEASQMYVEKGIPSIYRAKKVVIAGDPKQLRPSSLGSGRLDDSNEFYEDEILKDVSLDAKSLLDLARYRYKETLLNYHYRSKYEELIAFSNHAFYDGKLIISPNQEKSVTPPIEYVYVKNASFENRSNKEEAKAVVELLKKIFKTRENNESIGVITFNSAHRDMIENQVDQVLFKKGIYQKHFEKEMFRKDDGEDKSLFIKNIENVQGDERDIIIFSMGYAKNEQGQVMRRFGWLNQEGGQNRLNVAITRAKKKIYFVSSLYPEEFKVEDLQSKGPKLLKDFMRYCYYVSTNNDVLTKAVLSNLHQNDDNLQVKSNNEMILDLQKRIEKLGYLVDLNIGIGNDKINLAIKNKNTDDYLLGILCEFSKEHLYARRDLLHYEKYLQSRNWNTYRLLESNWYTDPNKELKNIKELLKNKLEKSIL